MVPQMLGIDFLWYSFYRGNFAPIALNESCLYLLGTGLIAMNTDLALIFVHMVSTGDFSEQEALSTELYLQVFSLYLMHRIQVCTESTESQ